MKLIQKDLDFIWAQLTLPGNVPLTPIDSTGIRDVQGVGNNRFNPYFGTADTLFPRLTSKSYDYSAKTGAFTAQFNADGTITPIYDPSATIDYSVRGQTIIDASPRIISNLVVKQPTDQAVQDDPSSTPGGRVSPLTGALNPLAYSGFMTMFGQFFDHGLDLVKKGVDGTVIVPLLPGDNLYKADGSPIDAMFASRTNTINVTIGEGSTDLLVGELGLSEGLSWITVTGAELLGPYTGTLVLNNQIITLDGADAAAVLVAINAATPLTGVIASLVAGQLVLTPAKGESMNTISPFVDLSQSYGSDFSHLVYLKEYDNVGNITGRLAGHYVNDTLSEMATWKDIKDNVAKIGLILHDYNITNIPLVEIDDSGAHFVVLDKVTGVKSFVQDTDQLLLTDAIALVNQVLVTTGHSFLDDIAHNAFSSGFDGSGDLNVSAVLDKHFIAGDGRTNENMGLTAIHDIFHSEHNLVLAQIKDMLITAGGFENTDGSITDGAGQIWTGEYLFQAAKLVSEMEYQHLVFAEFARKLSPNINAFAGYDVSIDSNIMAEFAHSVYRFGHSMLTEEVAMTGFGADGISTGVDKSMGLIQAFLNPGAVTGTTAGEIAIGMSSQVGNALDEWVTDALRDNLVGLPLDLATLNIVRGRDAGTPSLNEVRQSLFDQTGMGSLEPYTSWEDFGLHLLHEGAIKSFIMAYSRDVILNNYDINNGAVTPTDWNALQLSIDPIDIAAYALALSSAADDAISETGANAGFMTGGNLDFWKIDLWLGGLAEQKVTGGMLGSTFDFVFANQMIKLQNGDRLYYLDRLAGTNILSEIDSQTFADLVMRNTGVKHLYSDIFSVADSTIEMSTSSPLTYTNLIALKAADTAGYVNKLGGAVFYGNPGDYTDARGVLNANGFGNSSEVIGGTSANDRINGMGGNDALYGDAGNDTIDGGAGNDFLHGGDGNDLIRDSDGDDLIWGDDANTTVAVDGQTYNDTINAGMGIDVVFGGLGEDTIYGGLGADALDGQSGNDVIYGDNGSGSTVLISKDLGGKITNVTVSGVMDRTGDNDVITGGEGDDVIFGGGGADNLDGGVGDDWLVGGAGADVMFGWYGDDTFVMDAADTGSNNILNGGLGFDTVDYSASIAPTVLGTQGITVSLRNGGALAAPAGVNVADAYLSIESVIGSAFNDTLEGGDGFITDEAGIKVLDAAGNKIFMDFTLNGGAGNDLITGGGGNDILTGGTGIDTFIISAGIDSITDLGFGGTDIFTVAAGTTVNASVTQAWTASVDSTNAGTANITTGGFAVDLSSALGPNGYTVSNIGGDTTITGSVLADSITGGAGNDTLVGGAGNDTFHVISTIGNTITDLSDSEVLTVGVDAVANATLTNAWTATADSTNAGTANITTGGFTVNLASALGSNGYNVTNIGDAVTLTGSGFADSLLGGAGNDTLLGGAGNDTLAGSIGDNIVTGGTGNDTFIVTSSTGDIITDLSNGDVLTVGVDAGAIATVTAAWTATVASTNDGIANITTNGLSVNLLAITNGTKGYSVTNIGGAAALTGSALDDSLVGGAGNDALMGGSGADILVSGTGNDTLTGGSGADSMIGGDGSDRYVIELAGDYLGDTIQDIGAGVDELRFTSATTSTLTLQSSLVGIENVVIGTGTGATAVTTATTALNVDASLVTNALSITGNAGANTLTGSGSNDILIGGAGNDILIGGLGNDTLTGGNDTDTFMVVSGTDTITDLSGADVLTVGAGASAVATVTSAWTATAATSNAGTVNITTGGFAVSLSAATGTNGYSVTNTSATGAAIVGSAFADSLIGGSGNDTLTGGTGADSMTGGAGSDLYIISSAADYVGDTIQDIGAGVDELRFTSAATSTLTLQSSLVGIERVVIGTGTGATAVATATTALNVDASAVTNALSITGNAGANTLTGSGSNDILTGGDGNDTLIGGVGNDTLAGGIGTDTFRVVSGTDTITDLSGADVLVVGAGASAVATVTSAWTATAATINAGTVNITTGGFVVNLSTATGPNGYTVTNVGTAAAMTGSAFADSLIGGAGNDTLTGGAGADSMSGGAGNDVLRGDAGSDVLVGGLGNDTLTGGADSDFFVLNATLGATNIDTITDFVHLADNIQLENAIFTQLLSVGTLNAANFRSSLDGTAADANDYILYNSVNGQLYYDSNGIGAGGATQIALIGTLSHAALTFADFTVI